MGRFAIVAVQLCCALVSTAFAQSVQVRSAPRLEFPAETDSNSPAVWLDGELVLYNSTGLGPMRSTGRNQSSLNAPQPVVVGSSTHKPFWIEATWVDSDGTVFAWYHHEPPGVCRNSRLTAPQIGALLSRDRGRTFIDLGIVLTAPYLADCSSQNGFFAGGNGDFTVVLNRSRKYFYFLFSTYSGPTEEQGIAVARMPFEFRYNPVGAVTKYFDGDWLEPGLYGRASPIFPAKVGWKTAETDSYWGPSVHWNWYLNSWVMLMNRSCCSPGWPQEGIYVSFNDSSLGNPGAWTEPVKILDGVQWYPQVLGLGRNDSDKLAGQVARLYVYGVSEWYLLFQRKAPPPAK